MSNTQKQDDRKATQEWVAIQSAFLNDVLLLGQMFGLELFPYLDRNEENGAITAVMKKKHTTKATTEQVEEVRKIYLEKKIEHQKLLGEKNLDNVTIFDIKVSPEKLELKDQELEDAFWEFVS